VRLEDLGGGAAGAGDEEVGVGLPLEGVWGEVEQSCDVVGDALSEGLVVRAVEGVLSPFVSLISDTTFPVPTCLRKDFIIEITTEMSRGCPPF